MLHGPRALLVPATATGSLGGFYMAYRQIVEEKFRRLALCGQDYVKQLSRESVKSQLTQARDVLGTFPGLHDAPGREMPGFGVWLRVLTMKSMWSLGLRCKALVGWTLSFMLRARLGRFLPTHMD